MLKYAKRAHYKSNNRVIAEAIVSGRGKERLIETIEYYLNKLDELERNK